MNGIRLPSLLLSLILASCYSIGEKTIADLRHVQVEIKEEKIQDGIDNAMQGYQRFLEESPQSDLTPEAIRRLADLKIEKEYGTLTEDIGAADPKEKTFSPSSDHKETAFTHSPANYNRPPANNEEPDGLFQNTGESQSAFERRATRTEPLPTPAEIDEGHDLERASAREAIALYNKLLQDYPLYDRNDQVLYQMSRAYAELGQTEEAMAVMDRMVREYPGSRYYDEVQFRRAEHFFAYKHYLDAEDAYTDIVNIGVGSSYYELALYKLGWTFYKQELYEDGLHKFIALLDHKVSVGYDFEQTEDETEHKRTQDTFRVISLSFSNLGGADSVVEYFSRIGQRSYEDSVYSNLAEFYFDKRRYADATATYNAFVSRNPYHRVAPNFQMRIIDIHTAGGFPSLVLEAKKDFATTYGLNAEYWNYFEPKDRSDVLGYLKTNLTDLANHYHACYQNSKMVEDKPANFKEARHWYKEFLVSFPMESESSTINYQLADLLLENRAYGEAAVEYEKTAYEYPTHKKSSQAGYAAVCAYREQLSAAGSGSKDRIKREVVRSSLKFADTFPEHDKAAVALGAAADDLYGMREYEQALSAAGTLIERFPMTDVETVRSAYLVIGHSTYELQRYEEAESAYLKVLERLPPNDTSRATLFDNLAASIYKQGEQANTAQEYRVAADHYLRVGRMAPTSSIRPTAEYDAAVALIQLSEWDEAATVLTGFRSDFPGHELQPEVTKKIAYVYRENGKLSLAAKEYERIETETDDDDLRREALQSAAELHEEDGNVFAALGVYRRFVDYFPHPVEDNLETRSKIAKILEQQNDRKAYLEELEKIVAIDAAAGSGRTPRTRYLAAKAALVLAETHYERFVTVRLVKPFEANLRQKRDLMKALTREFNTIIAFEIGETTAASTFYLAEIYADFSKALMTSERPEGLSPLELEEYDLAIEEQAYPFEEKSIAVHESNLELISRGIYNEWIDKSLQKLAVLVPARYAKPEESSAIMSSLDTFVFGIGHPAVSVQAGSESESVANEVSGGGAIQGPDSGMPPNGEPAGLAPVQDPVDRVAERAALK
ncbi:MAG: tetratricopeptide repeat protein [Desulfobacterales bacterium]